MDPAYLASFNGTYDMVLLDIEWQIALIILFSSTAVLSFVSNVLSIFILLNQDRLTSELWKYLVNLSIADILMSLFCIPFTYTSFMLGRWIFFLWLCPVVQFAQFLSVLVSVSTLTVIGIDRYFAIVYPFHTSMFLKRHKFRVLIFIWIVSILVSSVQLVKTSPVPYQHGNETYFDCKETWTDEEGRYFTVIVLVLTFVLPISVLVFVYTSIALHLIRNTAPGNAHSDRDLNQWTLKIKVIKLLITIVVLFIFCWLPIHTYNFIIWFYPPNVTTMSTYMTVVISFFACHFVAMFHSCVNPILYCYMSENFKTSFRKLFCRRTYRDSRSEAEMEKLSNLTNVASAKPENSLKDINY